MKDEGCRAVLAVSSKSHTHTNGCMSLIANVCKISKKAGENNVGVILNHSSVMDEWNKTKKKEQEQEDGGFFRYQASGPLRFYASI